MSIVPVAYLATTEEFTLLSEEIRSQAITKLTQNGSNVTGRLASSITIDPVQITSTGFVVPITMLEYGKWVENGAERGRGKQPPVQAIEQWIKLKRISVPKQFKDPKQFAFAIAYNIGKFGQRYKKPRPFLGPAIDTVLQQFISAGKISNSVAIDINSNIQINANRTPGLNGNK